jgi:hypothetical protein
MEAEPVVLTQPLAIHLTADPNHQAIVDRILTEYYRCG